MCIQKNQEKYSKVIPEKLPVIIITDIKKMSKS